LTATRSEVLTEKRSEQRLGPYGHSLRAFDVRLAGSPKASTGESNGSGTGIRNLAYAVDPNHDPVLGLGKAAKGSQRRRRVLFGAKPCASVSVLLMFSGGADQF